MNINAFKCPVRGMLIYVGQSLAATWRLEEAVSTDVYTSNFPVPSLRLLRPLADGNSHQQLSKPQSSNFKAEQSQMVMEKIPPAEFHKKKPVDSKFFQ